MAQTPSLDWLSDNAFLSPSGSLPSQMSQSHVPEKQMAENDFILVYCGWVAGGVRMAATPRGDWLRR